MTTRGTRTIRHALTTMVLVALCCPAVALAASLGVLETPARLSDQTGVGLISGWHCDGQKIEIRIDDGPPQRAGSGTSREDTRSVCGRADTGFGLLLNFTLQPPGEHRIVAYADGVRFDEKTFDSFRMAFPSVSGSPTQCAIHQFPRVGRSTIVEWDPELLNFRAVGVGPAPAVAGDYWGAVLTQNNCGGPIQAAHATFSVTYDAGLMGVTIHFASGQTSTYPPTRATHDASGGLAVRYGDVSFVANGAGLAGDVRLPPDSPCVNKTVMTATR